MSGRWGALLVVAGAVLAVAVVIGCAGGEEPYRLRLSLDHASGLRNGSEVRVGDVTAGRVASVVLGSGDEVIAELELDADQAPVGMDASVAISTLNLLGQKYVALDRGNQRLAAPSGFTVPDTRVSTSTNLDQVLDVLDADTRTRLAILINEAGFAMTGRRADFNTLLKELPHTAVAATRLLEQLVSDNRSLGHLVDRGDKFVAEITRERRAMTRMVDTVGQTATTFAARRAQLREMLARAPGTLRSLQHFLGDLRSTTVPLGPAARNVIATAPALTNVLEEVKPFRHAAEPAFVEARSVAPSLTRLADGATPVLRRANPTVRSLANFGQELVPVTDTLDRSIDNLLAVIHNWARAIQTRDGLSHIFNAQAVVTKETLLSLISQLAGSEGAARDAAAARPLPERAQEPAPRPRPDAPRHPGRVIKPLIDSLPGKPRQLDRPPGQGAHEMSMLLEYLLGP